VATNAGVALVREAVSTEDRMQAFLWRHLVPAQEFEAMVFNAATAPKEKSRKGKRGK
jgi:hypothetical protein